jgi:hypothetical protein
MLILGGQRQFWDLNSYWLRDSVECSSRPCDECMHARRCTWSYLLEIDPRICERIWPAPRLYVLWIRFKVTAMLQEYSRTSYQSMQLFSPA